MKRICILFLFLSLPLFSQSSVKVLADCSFPFNFTATGRIPANGFPNGSTLPGSQQSGCVGWVMVMETNGGPSVVSLQLESAPDSSGAAGTWVAFSGSSVTLTGCGSTNPVTAITQGCLAINGYQPWVSVHLTTLTGSGTVAGTVYGCRIDRCAGLFQAAGGGGGTSNVNLVQVGGAAIAEGQTTMSASIPVAIASDQSAVKVNGQAASGASDAGNPVKVGGSNGTNDYNLKVDSQGNNYNFLGCTNSTQVALSGTGYVEIVAGTASQVIQVCKVFVTSVSGGNPVVNTFNIASATVTTCGSPAVRFTGGGITGIDTDWGGALQSASGASICVKESVANSDLVTITYQKAAF